MKGNSMFRIIPDMKRKGPMLELVDRTTNLHPKSDTTFSTPFTVTITITVTVTVTITQMSHITR